MINCFMYNFDFQPGWIGNRESCGESQMDGEKEIRQLQKRLKELAERSSRQNIYTFTGFLGMVELDAFHRMEQELFYAHPVLFGGSEEAERMVVRFGDPEDMGYEEAFPITLLKIEPLLQKYADALGHRDFLGALMNLGIERSTLGDIFIKDNCGYLFCLDSIADFIQEELRRIRHTDVKCTRAEAAEILEKREKVRQSLTVSSERADVVIASLYHLSRAQSIDLFREQKVFINGRVCGNNSCFLKKEDVVSVRGKGKFFYDGVDRETKKGKLSAGVLLYQ